MPVADIAASGARMSTWALENFGATGLRLEDHSGLGYGSSISALGMTRILRANAGIEVLLKDVEMNAPKGVRARAKTGTLNFVSSLAGFIDTRTGRKLCFAIFTADQERRDGIPPEQQENPPGARAWARRSRGLQKELILNWAERFA